MKRTSLLITSGLVLIGVFFLITYSCSTKNTGSVLSGDVASAVYVKPGEYDEYYAFLSGGFSGQVGVYGLPSGRLLKVIPVFSVDAEKAY